MFELPKLPYSIDALEPYIGKNTVEFHYLKHHQGYVNKLNELIKGSEMENMSLEEIINFAKNHSELTAVYNNAAQVWNHNLYWKSLNPNKNHVCDEKLVSKINKTFGSVEAFKEILLKKGLEQFGSGWVWLAEDEAGNLMVYATSNADNPLMHRQKALLTVDVWEHGYYLDYQNRRADYLKNVIDNLLNLENIQG